MKLLVIGGSGIVGSIVLPYLMSHEIRVFDLRPPQDERLREGYVAGNVCDPAALRDAATGMDAVIYMAMGQDVGKAIDQQGRDAARLTSFDANVTGVYFALDAARQADVMHAVHASSLSVYQALNWRLKENRYFVDEDMPPDAQNLYGLTKRLGEEVCRNATREWGMSVNALRLCHPTADEVFIGETDSTRRLIATAASDVARAFDAALKLRAGFQAFHISGDYEEKVMRMTKAKSLLGWEPLARRSPASPV